MKALHDRLEHPVLLISLTLAGFFLSIFCVSVYANAHGMHTQASNKPVSAVVSDVFVSDSKKSFTDFVTDKYDGTIPEELWSVQVLPTVITVHVNEKFYKQYLLWSKETECTTTMEQIL